MASTGSIATRHDPYPVNDPYHGIYAHGVETRGQARTLYVSGQVGDSPEGHLSPDFEGQCRQAICNLDSVLCSAGMKLTDIVKLTFFLVRRQDMDALVKIRKETLDGVRPAITTVFVAGLVSPTWLVEVEAIACAD
ncbi:MAG: RidA family protein [Pseudomonadota bacterium]